MPNHIEMKLIDTDEIDFPFNYGLKHRTTGHLEIPNDEYERLVEYDLRSKAKSNLVYRRDYKATFGVDLDGE